MNQEFNNTVFTEPKKSNKAPLIVGLILLVIVGVGAYLFFGTDIFKDKKVDNTTNNTEEKKLDNSFNGIYEKDGKTIKLYQKSSKEVQLEAGNFSMPLKVANKTIFGDFLDNTCTMSLSDKGLEVDSTIDYVESGIYKKTKNYTKEDYYNDVIGSTEYLTSKFNGIYKDGKKDVEIFQTDKDTVRVNIKGEVGDTLYAYEHDFTVQADGTLKDDDGSTVKYNDNKVEINLLNTEYSKPLNGTYTKEKDITIDYIIENY